MFAKRIFSTSASGVFLVQMGGTTPRPLPVEAQIIVERHHNWVAIRMIDNQVLGIQGLRSLLPILPGCWIWSSKTKDSIRSSKKLKWKRTIEIAQIIAQSLCRNQSDQVEPLPQSIPQPHLVGIVNANSLLEALRYPGETHAPTLRTIRALIEYTPTLLKRG